MCYGCYGESILNILWLSRRLIICPEKTNTYISIFPNTLNYKVAKNPEISLYFSTSACTPLRFGWIISYVILESTRKRTPDAHSSHAMAALPSAVNAAITRSFLGVNQRGERKMRGKKRVLFCLSPFLSPPLK